MSPKPTFFERIRSSWRYQPSDRGNASHGRWWVAVLCGLGGILIGILAVAIYPMVAQRRAQAAALPAPEPMTGSSQAGLPKLAGDVQTLVRSFALEDLDGNTVLKVDRLTAFVDLDAMRRGLVRMPRGHASHIQVLLRRGKSGRVSLSEAVRATREPPERHKSPTRLDIGPLQIEDVDMTVDMGGTPIVLHVDRARIRIQRNPDDLAPRVFLSHVHGRMVKPQPLPRPISIRGAEGLVKIEGGPLVDLRARACLGNSELRLRIELPERRTRTHMTVDADGPLANAALLALGLVSRIKDDKLAVDYGDVEVAGKADCSRDDDDVRADEPERAEETR
jgi:hypothetical protein